MILLGAMMIGLAITGLLRKRTLLGFVVSFQFLSLGCILLFLSAGGARGYSVSLLIVVVTLLYSVGMLSLATRLHYLKPGARLNELRNLRR